MDNDHIEAVSKMQQFIETHWNERITLKQLAEVSGYSPWYANRIFKTACGLSPFVYIKALRLSKAAITLRDHPQPILTVALDFTFDSHEGFTRAFSKQFGISPKRYRQITPPIRLFIPYDVRHYFNYIKTKGSKITMKKSIVPIFTQIIERPKRKAIIKRGVKAQDYFEYCEEVGCDVWGVLCSIKEALYEPAGMWLPKHLIQDQTSLYVQGVEVAMEYQGSIPKGFDLITLEACQYMVFQGPTYDDEFFLEAIGEVKQAIKTFNPKTYGVQFASELAPRIQLEPCGERGYIEAIPIKSSS